VAGLGDILVQQGVLSSEQLHQAESHLAAQGGSLAKALVELRLATESDLVRALASTIGLPYTDVDGATVDPKAVSLLSPATARELNVLPVRFGDRNDVVVAVAETSGNEDVLVRLRTEMGIPVTLALTSRRALLEAIAVHMPDREPVDAPAPEPARATLPAVAEPPAPKASPFPEPSLVPPPLERLTAPAGPLVMSEEAVSLDLDDLLNTLIDRGGSDLHLTVGIPPAIRVNGELEHLDDFPVSEPDDLRKLLYAIMTQKQREAFENDLELDMSYSIPGRSRFRVNVFQQRDAIGSVMRVIPFEIKPLEDLGIPAQVANFAYLPRGFVLVTGPTGSGKSTTLASLIDLVNRNRASHIMTVEDPIEFLHEHKRSVVNQREVGTDTHGFTGALKHVLRQDPDVILVGELRDLETIQIALTAAETGHLVFATLHTQDAPQTIDRVVDVFPPHQQEQIRVMLAGSLKGVVCQTLVKTADGKGRVPACEVMVATSGIRNLIREGKTHQVYSAIQAGAKDGMVAMDQSLATLVKNGKVTYDAALEKASQVAEFNRLAGRA
jgi:twitching motility protein PilT